MYTYNNLNKKHYAFASGFSLRNQEFVVYFNNFLQINVGDLHKKGFCTTLKKFVLTSVLLASLGVAHAQTAASAVVLSAGVAGGSKVQDASAIALSVPLALTVAGAQLIVDTAVSTAKGVAYGMRRVSDGAKVSVEVLGQKAGTVVAISGGVVLSAAGQAIAFIPNKVGQSLMQNRIVK